MPHRSHYARVARRVYHWEWPRSFPIAQFPNAPLLVGLLGSLVVRVADGGVDDAAFALATAGYGVWAGWEVVGGVNWFRRLLGVAGIAWIVVTRLA